MNRVFVNTQNVKFFKGAVERLQNREEQVPGMGLIFGEPGLGKTKTVAAWCAQNGNNSYFIRTKKLMTGRWLLEELVSELGEQADKRVADLYRQARNIMMEKSIGMIIAMPTPYGDGVYFLSLVFSSSVSKIPRQSPPITP